MTEAEDFNEFVEPLQKLVSLGVKIPTYWVYDKTKIPQPKEGEAVLQLAESAPATLAALKANATNTLDPAEIELAALTEQLATQADQQSQSFIEQLQHIVETADSFEQMRSQLMQLPQANQPLTELISQALTVASIAGRYDILQEAQ